MHIAYCACVQSFKECALSSFLLDKKDTLQLCKRSSVCENDCNINIKKANDEVNVLTACVVCLHTVHTTYKSIHNGLHYSEKTRITVNRSKKQ